MKCNCGRDYVRRIPTGEKSSYILPESTSGHYWPGKTPTLVMKYASDGMCKRCKEFGAPTLSHDALIRAEGERLRGTGNYAESRRAIENIKIHRKIG